MIRGGDMSRQPTRNFERGTTKAQRKQTPRALAPADLLPEHVWGRVIQALAPRPQAIVACAHPVWRRICSDPSLTMHRVHLRRELDSCHDAASIIGVLQKHRATLLHIDTLSLQPRLIERLCSGWNPQEEKIDDQALSIDDLHRVLDWLAAACSRNFFILAVARLPLTCLALVNGKDMRHPAITPTLATYIPGPDTTKASFLESMREYAHVSEAVAMTNIDDRIPEMLSDPNFWRLLVQTYPQTLRLNIYREGFFAAGKLVDACCALPHLEALGVPGLVPPDLPAGLARMHREGRLRLL